MKQNKQQIEDILKRNNQGIKLDIGCGANKQPGGFIGIDARQLDGVDIVHNLEHFPWPFPDQSVGFAIASHILEHINPSAPDTRLVGLINLLLDKKLINKQEVDQYIGEYDNGPIFLRMMNEIWRIMKPFGQLIISTPYGLNKGYFQDPTHNNPIIPATFAYFDPLAGTPLYAVYEPAPWRIVKLYYDLNGNIEAALERRVDDKSYHKDQTIHYR
jgi:SAM-dependent methyltransferase